MSDLLFVLRSMPPASGAYQKPRHVWSNRTQCAATQRGAPGGLIADYEAGFRSAIRSSAHIRQVAFAHRQPRATIYGGRSVSHRHSPDKPPSASRFNSIQVMSATISYGRRSLSGCSMTNAV